MPKLKFKWPEVVKPQLKTREERRKYLERPRVKRWLERNAEGLRVLDVRHFHCTQPDVIEFTEIYYRVDKRGGAVIKVKLVCGDPPPYLVRAAR